MLTNRIRLERQKRERELRRLSNDGIKIFNTARAMRVNPFAGDTTVISRSVDNKTDHGAKTLDDVIDSVCHRERRARNKKSDAELRPWAVSDEVKDFWLQKINASRVRGALNLKKS